MLYHPPPILWLFPVQKAVALALVFPPHQRVQVHAVDAVEQVDGDLGVVLGELTDEGLDALAAGGQLPVRRALGEATGALENYFYLDTLKKGKGGQVTLKVALDGETQGNAYQDTRAQVQMNFAVELEEDGTTTKKKRRVIRRGTVAKTGDDTNWNLYFILAAISGAAMLGIGAYSVKLRKEEKEDA